MRITTSEIDLLCETYERCVYEKDYVGLADIYHENIHAFDLWGTGIYEGKADWSKNLEDWLRSLGNEKVEVKFDSLEFEVNEKIGFAHAQITYRAIDENNIELRKMRNRLSWGLIKGENKWLIVHQHTSVPIEFETTKAIFYPDA